jgi:hypothetical protein
MNQGRGRKGLTECLGSESGGHQLPQLVVDEQQQLLDGVRIVLLDGRQDAGDLAYNRRE